MLQKFPVLRKFLILLQKFPFLRYKSADTYGSLSLSLSLSLDVKFTTFVTFHLQQYNLIVDTFNQKVITFQALVECEEALLLIWLY